jgi:two-component system phosphate regulon sensor histidine kinase PhoR
MNSQHWVATRSGVITAWLAAVLCCGVAVLAWYGYRAANEWLRNSERLIASREIEIGRTLRINLGPDMRAVEGALLSSPDWEAVPLQTREEIAGRLARIFSRYSYPEVFFLWRVKSPIAFFARRDRIPPWLASTENKEHSSIVITEDPPTEAQLRKRLDADLSSGSEYSIFETRIHDLRYQVVARKLRQSSRKAVDGVFGFMVNLDWAKTNYLAAMAEQIVKDSEGTDYAIVDDEGKAVPGHPSISAERHPRISPLPVLFFNQGLVAEQPPADLAKWSWTFQVSSSRDPTLTIAARGAQRTMIVVAAAVLAFGIGLLFIVRGTRASAELATMRSEFVSAATHGLKTPLTVIQGIGQTMVRGRVTTPEQQNEYAQLLIQETYRLRRLIENLLAYARITKAADAYEFSPLKPVDLINETMRGFQSLAKEGGFTFDVDVPKSLPQVNGDRTAIVLALGNLIDNAMRYSGGSRLINLRVRASGREVEFAIMDHGNGIPAEDLHRVQKWFARGRAANGDGSGLGLAIVSRVAQDHGGRFHLESTPDVGTSATLVIPCAREQ